MVKSYQLRNTLKTLDLKKSGKWKIRLKMEMNFIPSKDSDGKRLMHSKSDNEDIMTSFDTEKSIEELFKSLLHR